MARVTFEQSLGELLGSVSGSLRAGLSFGQALATVSISAPAELKAEMDRVLADVGTGQKPAEAFRSLARRRPSEDLDFLAAALEMNEQSGGDLTRVLDTISSSIRERAHLRAELRAGTARVRTSGLVLALLPVALIVVLMAISPGYYSPVWSNVYGVAILGAGAVLTSLGFLMMRLIVRSTTA